MHEFFLAKFLHYITMFISVDVVQKLVSFAKESPVIQLVLSSKAGAACNVEKRGRKRKLSSAEDLNQAEEGTILFTNSKCFLLDI